MIEVADITVRSGAFELKDISFRVPSGAYAVLMGRTGTGKSTLLEAICGLKPLARGSVVLAGRDVTRLKPSQRGIGYVPQDGALFGNMSVFENLAFALRIRKVERSVVSARVNELAELLGIEALLGRSPATLSGGERQRVALGRALAFKPAILLLDEPLSAVDEDTREEMYRLLKTVQSVTAATMLHVTHNREEAERLGDFRLRIENGCISDGARKKP